MPDNDNQQRKQPSRPQRGDASNDNDQVSDSEQVSNSEGPSKAPRGEAIIGAGNKVHGDMLEGIIPGKSQSQDAHQPDDDSDEDELK
jgi:hypothetical protein